MKFEYEGSEFRIRFHYEYKTTRVEIVNYLAKSIVVNGDSYCAPSDRFCKETGRKIALKRALHQYLPKSFRTAVWKAYHGRKGACDGKE